MTYKVLYRLMSWFSPSYPIGSFNYSHSLEYAIETRQINDRESLQEWVAAILQWGTGRRTLFS